MDLEPWDQGCAGGVDMVSRADQRWPWWPLLPLYPYGRRHTVFSELIPGQVWSLEQLQGVYYVAVPVGGRGFTNIRPPGTLATVSRTGTAT